MSLLANNFAAREHTEVHLLLIGIKRNISYPLDERVIVHRPSFKFNNSRRTWDTLKTMRFIREEVKKIAPETVLSFGELWNNLVLLSLAGTRFPIYVSDRSQPGKDLGRLHNMLRRMLYPSASGFIAQTKKAEEICRSRNWNSNINVIGNPLREIPRNDNLKKENIVLTVGRLIRTKHIDQMIRIFSETKNSGWKLVIVGGDAKKLDLSEELQKLVEELELGQQIVLAGQQKDVDSYYNRSKIFAFASSSEGFPNVIGEALTAGLPVVAYDCTAGPADMIEDGKNGFLVPLFDQQKFKEKMNQLMSDHKLRKKLGSNARSVLIKFESEAILNEFYKFITTGHDNHN